MPASPHMLIRGEIAGICVTTPPSLLASSLLKLCLLILELPDPLLELDDLPLGLLILSILGLQLAACTLQFFVDLIKLNILVRELILLCYQLLLQLIYLGSLLIDDLFQRVVLLNLLIHGLFLLF